MDLEIYLQNARHFAWVIMGQNNMYVSKTL